MLPRLIVGGDEMKKYPVLLPESCRQFDFITASLAIFGFTPLFLAEHKLYSLKEMVFISTFSTPGNYHDAIMKQMRGKFIGNYPITKRSKPVYISRAKATRRKVKNESSLVKLFKETGVEIIEAENLSFLEQVELFSTVTIMISNHGAGLTNMIFMPPGSTVIEIRHSGDAHNNCYYALANALELNYYYQSSIQAEKEEDIHLSDITVDVDLLKSVIELALRQTDISGPMNTLLN